MSAQSPFLRNLLQSHHSNPTSLFKHLGFLTTPITFHELWSKFPLLFINLLTKLNYSTGTSTLCSLLVILYFHLSMNFLHHNHSWVISRLTRLMYLMHATHSTLPRPTGCDNINPYILKLCSSSLTSPITQLFSHILSPQTIPTQWKIHKVCPIFKKGERALIRNYPLISLLCLLHKVLESIFFKQSFHSCTTCWLNLSSGSWKTDQLFLNFSSRTLKYSIS